MKKNLPVLYKHTSKKQIQQWQICVNGNTFYTKEGIKDGKITISKPTLCTGKNIGKKNETSPIEQALVEAQAKHQKKLDKGYAEVLGEGTKFFEPMLAEDYLNKETGEPNDWIDEIVWDSGVKIFVQPKLDGLRAINQKNTLESRGGKPFVTCPHLYQNEVILDGELYNHSLKNDFNGIVSIIKQSKATEEDLAKAKSLAQMWVYDMPSHPGTFAHRIAALKEWVGRKNHPGIELVPTYMIENEEDLLYYHKLFKSEGYEGTIIRLDKPYENKRTTSLLKYKDFIDEEFEILGYEEGKGGRIGTIGKFILKHDKDPKKTFKCNVKGKFPYLRKVWENRDYYIGKQATVQYFNRTPLQEDGKGDVPRFGYCIKLDRQFYE